MLNHKKWNISLIVLFILAITSLLGLLAFQNVQSMIEVNADDLFATKSLYYSKAWVELWVALSNGYWIGFEDKVTNKNWVNKNFQCYSKNQCGTEFSISNRSRTYLTNIPWDNQQCTENNSFKLKEWESLIVPLFLDNRKLDPKIEWKEFESILPDFGDKPWKNLSFDLFLPNTVSWTDILLSFALGSGAKIDRDILFKIYTWITQNKAIDLIDDFLYDTKPLYYKKDSDWNLILSWIESKVSKFSQFPNFLVINYPTHCPWNSQNPEDIIKVSYDKKWDEVYNCSCKQGFTYSWNINKCIYDKDPTVVFSERSIYKNRKLDFCLKIWENLQKNWVATTSYLIDSQWKYWSQHTSLQAIKKTALPSWLFNTAIQNAKF